MRFIAQPNLPERPITLAAADGRIAADVEGRLSREGIRLIKTQRYPGMYEAVAFHPDLQIHHIAGGKIVYAPGTAAEFLQELLALGFQIIPGQNALTSGYPGNIAYNAARIGNKVFHHLKYMDPILKKELEKEDVELIHVNQGYTKCAVAVTGTNSMITADRGIAQAAEKNGVEVLLVEQEGILLPGLSEGFIGGSTGLIGPGRLAVTGDAQKLVSFQRIHSFLSARSVDILSLSPSRVTDYGSLLPLAIQ